MNATGRKPLYAKKTGGPDYMNLKQAAAYLGVSAPTLRKMRDEGRIPFERLGPRTFRVSRDELDGHFRKTQGNRDNGHTKED